MEKTNAYQWIVFSLVFLLFFLWRVSVLPAFGKSMEVLDPLWMGILCLCVWKQWPQAFLWATLSGILVIPYEKISDGVFLVSYVACVWVGRYLITSIFTQERWFSLWIIGGILSTLFFCLVWGIEAFLVFLLGTAFVSVFVWKDLFRFVFVHSFLLFLIWGSVRAYVWMRYRNV